MEGKRLRETSAGDEGGGGGGGSGSSNKRGRFATDEQAVGSGRVSTPTTPGVAGADKATHAIASPSLIAYADFAKDTPATMPWLFPSRYMTDSWSIRDLKSADLEANYRRGSSGFIIEVGRRLQYRNSVVSTALLYFHWFFTLQSFVRHDRVLVAVVCLYLAGKVEEQPKKPFEIFQKMQAALDQRTRVSIDPQGEHFQTMLDKLCVKEKILLHTIEFNVCVDLPYRYINAICEPLRQGIQRTQASRALATTAANFAFDCYRSSLCVYHHPKEIAVAMIYLAAVVTRFPIKPRFLFDSCRGQPDGYLERLQAIIDQFLGLFEGGNRGPCVAADPSTPSQSPVPSSDGPPPLESVDAAAASSLSGFAGAAVGVAGASAGAGSGFHAAGAARGAGGAGSAAGAGASLTGAGAGAGGGGSDGGGGARGGGAGGAGGGDSGDGGRVEVSDGNSVSDTNTTKEKVDKEQALQPPVAVAAPAQQRRSLEAHLARRKTAK